jgi:hypothetical protein
MGDSFIAGFSVVRQALAVRIKDTSHQVLHESLCFRQDSLSTSFLTQGSIKCDGVPRSVPGVAWSRGMGRTMPWNNVVLRSVSQNRPFCYTHAEIVARKSVDPIAGAGLIRTFSLQSSVNRIGIVRGCDDYSQGTGLRIPFGRKGSSPTGYPCRNRRVAQLFRPHDRGGGDREGWRRMQTARRAGEAR